MIDQLKKYLNKMGVTEFSQLTDEEKNTYRQWEEVLSGKKLTDEDVRSFLDGEMEDALSKLNPDLSTRMDMFLKLKIDMIRRIRAFLDAPKVEKRLLEENIEKLV